MVLGDLVLAEARARHVADLFHELQLADLIEPSPCILDERQLGPLVDKDPGWRNEAVFARDEVETIISDARIPADLQLVASDFSSVTMTGTYDLNGVTCSDPTAATQICRALHNRSSASVSCNGHTWSVGQCGGLELAVDNPVCFCTFGQSHTVRPCTSFNWGGINTETCDGLSQNMTVICE